MLICPRDVCLEGSYSLTRSVVIGSKSLLLQTRIATLFSILPVDYSYNGIWGNDGKG